MDTMPLRAFSGLVLAMLVPVVSAQQLAQPPAAPTLTLPSETTLGTSNGSQLRQAVAAPSVLSDPAQRAGSTARVAEKGPSNAPPMPKEPPQPLPAAPRPVLVVDAQGRPVRGALKVAPNRIYDPGTGRYHQTTPIGEQQKIID